jgi:hypothetical protein
MKQGRVTKLNMFFTSTKSAWISFVLLMLLASAPDGVVRGQVVQEARLEYDVTKDNAERFQAVSLNENGLILYRRITGAKDDQLDMVRVDTTLAEMWHKSINVAKQLSLVLVRRHQDHLFLLLKDRNTLGGAFIIVAVRTSNGNYSSYPVQNMIPFTPSEFEVTNQSALVGGYFNFRPLVLYYNFATQKTKILPGFFNEVGELNQLKTYPDGTSDIIVCAKNLQKRKSLWIKNYDAQGDLIKNTLIEPGENKNLLFGRSVKLSSGEQVVAGVYGRYAEYSRGIFVAGINDKGEYGIKYYNFSELKNFFSYMKVKRQKRIHDRIERRTLAGKKVKFNYRFLIHDIVPYGNQYIMTGEAFYPKYVYPNYYYGAASRSRVFYPSAMPRGPYALSGVYNTPFYRGDLIFDGYQYTHAVVVGFDTNGKIQWDNSFEINDVKTYQLEQFVKIKPEQDRILMMYLYEHSLRTKVIHDSQVVEGKSKDEMKEVADGDEIIDTKGIENEQLDFWYGKYFFAAGIQRFKPKTEIGTSRRVFFVSKISYH